VQQTAPIEVCVCVFVGVFQNLGLRISAGWLRACLHSWHCYSRKLSGAARLLRRLLVSTLSGAFHEWRDVALEAAYWHKVGC
jgi:hypothetical protein